MHYYTDPMKNLVVSVLILVSTVAYADGASSSVSWACKSDPVEVEFTFLRGTWSLPNGGYQFMRTQAEIKKLNGQDVQMGPEFCREAANPPGTIERCVFVTGDTRIDLYPGYNVLTNTVLDGRAIITTGDQSQLVKLKCGE